MTASTWFRWSAIVAMVLLTVAAGVFSKVVADMDEDLARVMRYDIAWSAANGRLEAAQLEKHVARYAFSGEEPEADAARLFYQILIGRLRIWDAGDFDAFLSEQPALKSHFIEIRESVHNLSGHFDRLERPDAQRAILATLAEVNRKMIRLGNASHTISLGETAQTRDELKWREFIQWVLILCLFAVGLVLLILSGFQNVSLSRANAETRRLASRFAFQAEHDALTSLPNRAAFRRALANAKSACSQAKFAVLAIDLDGFKTVNDSMGHGAGDALLVSVAQRLTDTVQAWHSNNLVARLGGDEFAVLLHGVDGVGAAVECGKALQDLLRRPHELSEGSVSIDATIGAASSATISGEFTRLPLDADLALTQAKSSTKGAVVPFDPAMRAAAHRRIGLERDLSAAIRTGELFPLYQPQINLHDGTVAGFEALARWRHRYHGWVSPLEFISIAEASGRIVDLGELILRTACHDAVAFPGKSCVAVNLSVVQLVRADLVERVSDILKRTGLSPRRLKLEVTESLVMKDPDRSIAALTQLKELGIRIALDDFGIGYSAFSYLRLFAWDELKIDRSFIASMADDPQSYAIVKAIISLSAELGIDAIAEGVETRVQQDLLRKAGCSTVQGFLYGHPVPARDATAASRRWAADAFDACTHQTLLRAR